MTKIGKNRKNSSKDIPPVKTKRGRPSTNKQVLIQKQIREYFDIGVTAFAASYHSGINKNTVCKYFKKWTDELLEEQKRSSFERIETAGVRHILTLEHIIKDVKCQLERIKKKEKLFSSEKNLHSIKNLSYRNYPCFFENKIIELNKFLADLEERKARITMIRTPSEIISEEIDKFIEKKNREKM